MAAAFRRRPAGGGSQAGPKQPGGDRDWRPAGRFAWHLKNGSMTSKAAEIWAPWQVTNEMRERHGRFACAVARLKPGVTPVQAQSEMDTIAARLAQQYPDFDTKWGVNVVPLRTQFTGEIRKPLLILLGAVSSVL